MSENIKTINIEKDELKYSVKRKLVFFGIAIVLMIISFGVVKYNSIISVQNNYDTFREKVVEGKFLVLEIEKEMNYISRATRDIMLGNSYQSNYDRLLKSKKIILEAFVNLEKTIKDMPDEETKLQTIKASREKTLLFVDDGIAKMEQLGKVDRTPEVLASMYAQYKEDSTPLANANREAFAKIVEEKEKEMEFRSDELHKKIDNFVNFIVIESLLFLVFVLICFVVLAKNITSSLSKFKDGLVDFFMFLNKEKENVSLIDIKNKDEFGQMAKIVNENIKKTEKSIIDDRNNINEIISVFNEFEKGDFSQRIKSEITNPSLGELKTVLNKMADNLEKNINNVLEILNEYSSHNYINRTNPEGLKEHLLNLANNVNILGEAITNILIENKSNGLTLKESSEVLLENVDKLNISSNQAAASLEETAAALEEITSNIRNNTENITKMSKYSNDITKASNEGEELANKTTIAMEEINAQVNLVNEAISVIDQIAFQTNILSLNAAVEAATAGEAGKGFAVVAGEVRNLASRSSEAAKEIKNIVERATSKANEGKQIANSMIRGYEILNNNISQTLTLISDIEMASKEQLVGIEQINDAVNQLDKQTQQNANIANLTHDIANRTDEISKLIVSNADAKKFRGKEKIEAKVLI